jgi:hypothetical protein
MTFNEKEIIETRNDILGFIFHKIDKYKNHFDFKTGFNTYCLTDIGEISKSLCIDYDFVIWLLLGENFNKPNWGSFKRNYPSIYSGFKILDIEMPLKFKFGVKTRIRMVGPVKKIIIENFTKMNPLINKIQGSITSKESYEKIIQEKDVLIKEYEKNLSQEKSKSDFYIYYYEYYKNLANEVEYLRNENNTLKNQLSHISLNTNQGFYEPWKYSVPLPEAQKFQPPKPKVDEMNISNYAYFNPT